MASDDGKPTPTVLRIKVRHADLDVFVERFASQVTRSGVFIPTRTPKPVGTEIRFEIRTADDRPVLVGQGQVRLIRAHDPAHPRAVAGMAVELQRVGRDSKDALLRMLEVRKRRGLVDGPGGMPLPADPEAEEAKDEVTIARAPRPRPVTAPPAPAEEPLPMAPPPPPPSAPALAPAAVRRRPSLDLAAVVAPAVTDDDDLHAWPEAQRAMAEVVARARALVGDDLDGELADAAVPAPVVDLATARAAAVAALGRPLRALVAGRGRAAPLPSPSTPMAVAVAAVAVEDAAAVPAPPPEPAAAVPAFDEATALEVPTFPVEPVTAAELAPAEPEDPVDPPTATDKAALASAVATETADAASRARAARAQRERAKREANDRALRDRNNRIQRELAERERVQRARAATPAIDPFADLDLDEAPPAAPPPGDTTRRVDAASLAAEALGAADLRSSLAGSNADLQFLEALSFDEPAPPRRRAAHTVPRTAPSPAPQPAPPPPRSTPARAPLPGPPLPASIDIDLDDDEVEISIDIDE